MESLNGHVMNLANSIIGVSVLAMPYCFKQCGIILSVLLLLMSSIVSRLTCHFLLKSAIISRRKTFELLAFHLFGGLGKLAIELGMIGFLLGTCIAYFVVMGDLGPVILSEITKSHISSTMHTSILMALALFVVLPLGLLRNVHSLNSVSRATMVFYCCLVLKVIIEALPRLFEDNWYHEVNLWKPEGLLQCIPIFSMALFCQTQLFEIYEVVPNPTLDKMNNLIQAAVNFCTGVYICVGIFGYIAFANKNFSGNILLSFEPSLISHIMKVGFIFSVAFSFPLVIFPCRASLYSLLYKEGFSVHEGSLNYIAEGKFKALTFIIVFVSLVIAILIPNIELVLGLVGSTIGVMVCVLFPVTCFICILQKNTNERILAQILLAIGIFVMVVGTYRNIQRVDQMEPIVVTSRSIMKPETIMENIPNIIKKLPLSEKHELKTEIPKMQTEVINKEIRHEPPQPIEPVEEEHPKKEEKVQVAQKINNLEPPDKNILPAVKNENPLNETRIDQVDIEAIKKEDKEEQIERKEVANEKEENINDHKVLIDTIQKQNEVQKEMKEIVEQQKQILEVIKKQQKKEEYKKMDEVKQEKMKAVKEIESIALKAIEKISEGEDSKKVVDEMKKGIEKNELKISVDKNSEKSPKDNEIPDIKIDKTIENHKEEKDFEKKVVNLKMEIQELSSQLNQVDKEIKHNEATNNEAAHKNIKIDDNQNLEHLPQIKEEPGLMKINNEDLHQGQKNVEVNNQVKKDNISASNINQKLEAEKIGLKNNGNNLSKFLPLPIAILNKNYTKPDKLPLLQNEDEKNKIFDKQQANEEVQAMRRDILSVSTEN